MLVVRSISSSKFRAPARLPAMTPYTASTSHAIPHVSLPRSLRFTSQLLMAFILMNVGMAVLLEEFGTASQRFRDQASAQGGALDAQSGLLRAPEAVRPIAVRRSEAKSEVHCCFLVL